MHRVEGAQDALLELEDADLDGLAAREILRQARSLQDWPPGSVPDALMERLSKGEAAVVQQIALEKGAPAEAADSVRTLKRLRYSREKAELQREIDRLQQAGAAIHDHEIIALWERKKDLLQRLDKQ
jgi:hypothetical protein